MSKRRIVITGLGAVTPIGNTVEEFWTNLINGKSGAAPITYFDTTHFDTKFACEIKNFDPLNYMDRKLSRLRLDQEVFKWLLMLLLKLKKLLLKNLA